jgi:hypothetical protein
MAKKASNIIHDIENNQWIILETQKDGTDKRKDTVPDVEPMEEVEALQVFQGYVKEETKLRRAALAMLVHIWLTGSKAENKLDLKKHLGKGDLKTGQLGLGVKEDYRKAEDAFFDQWNREDHPAHKQYVGRLPVVNERNEEIPPTDRHSYFVTRTRKAPSYANAKNLFLNYVAYVGDVPFTMDDKGETVTAILPPEVMRKRVDEAKQAVPQPDNSWEKKMQDLIRQLLNPDNPEKPMAVRIERIPGLLQDMKACMAELERRERVAKAQEKKLAEVHRKYHPEGAPGAAADAIKGAQGEGAPAEKVANAQE